jgi:hypothetical protein
MTLESRIKEALTAIGTDVKALQQAGGGGGSLPPWQTATVDLGGTAERRSVFVPVAGMVPTAMVEVQRSTAPAPGKGSDEHLAEPAVLTGFAWTDGFWLLVMAQSCTIGGSMNINYRVT